MQNEFKNTLQNWLGIPPATVEEIGSFFQKKQLKKEGFFLKTEQFADSMGFLQSGIIREYFIDHKGREVTKWIATPGYFVVDIASFLFQQPSRWNLQALTDCELLVITKDNYQRIGQVVPKWLELEKRFIAKCFAVLEDRVAAHLSLSSEERYTLFFSQNPELFNQVPLQYLASMLGMTAETFSRIRKKQQRLIS
ncbi:MAG: cyclic nucleotide-binding domain-containing protein [Bacteroidetes bacterium]|nr:cyclic nucleotide-binding domain-containing protein [Bacteroidota bacterium]